MKSISIFLILVFAFCANKEAFYNSESSNIDRSDVNQSQSLLNSSSHNVQQNDLQENPKPEETVAFFYNALVKRNRKDALRVASPKVVNALFKKHQKNINWHFINCEEPKVKQYGDVACFYYFQGGGIGMFLRKKTDGKYRIVSTYYMTED